MKVSFIIPTYNTLALTRECLESLSATLNLANHETFVMDDGSTDGTPEYLSTLPAQFQVIRDGENKGYARRCNQAAKLARSELLCFCNSDLVFTPGWLKPMLKVWRNRSSVGFVGNLQRRVSDQLIDHTGVGFHADGNPYHLGQGSLHSPARHVLEMSTVTAACCLISRETFLKFGGYDEVFLNGYEDTDLCMRLRAAGYRHYVSTRSMVFHHVSASPGRHDRETENRTLYLQRWKNAGVQLHAEKDAHWRDLQSSLKKSRFFQFRYYFQFH